MPALTGSMSRISEAGVDNVCVPGCSLMAASRVLAANVAPFAAVKEKGLTNNKRCELAQDLFRLSRFVL